MLGHELSSLPVRFLLTGGVLKDAGRNHHTVAGVDPVVSQESRDVADNGQPTLTHNPRHFAWVGDTLVPPYCHVHRFTLPPFWPALEKRRVLTRSTTSMMPGP